MEETQVKMPNNQMNCILLLQIYMFGALFDDHFISYYKVATVVHPCDEANNGGCDQVNGVCIKNGEVAVCSCNPGYLITNNGTFCVKGNKYRCVTVEPIHALSTL